MATVVGTFDRVLLLVAATCCLVVLIFVFAVIFAPDFRANGVGVITAILGPMLTALSALGGAYYAKRKSDDEDRNAK